ncbi:MAG: hypothetical protein WBM43_08145 [Flavobacteriaceae bacterium]
MGIVKGTNPLPKDMKVNNHYSYTDDQLLSGLKKATLNPSLFSHEAHLRWGWLLLQKFGRDKAINRACVDLKNYTKVLGVPDKYNETVTAAAIGAIAHFRKKSQVENFVSFIKENPRLLTSFKELMENHYSNDIFNSTKARQSYQDPDLCPFD